VLFLYVIPNTTDINFIYIKFENSCLSAIHISVSNSQAAALLLSWTKMTFLDTSDSKPDHVSLILILSSFGFLVSVPVVIGSDC
jgi:hypothetical protein